MDILVKILIDNISKSDLTGEWGLAIYIEYKGHKILLDTGTTGVFAKNALEMGVKLEDVEVGVLSHAHFDHSDGFGEFFEVNHKAKFLVREGADENCYKRSEEGTKYIGIHEGYLEKYAARIQYVSGDYEIMEGAYLIPHKTQGLEEIGKKANMYIKEGEVWVPDDFAHEQSLVFETEKGLVILNSCSHGGADNIINEVAATFPNQKIYAIIGGFHLFETADEGVRAFAQRVKATGIKKVITGHCTGDRAFEILEEELGEIVQQMYVGMTCTI